MSHDSGVGDTAFRVWFQEDLYNALLAVHAAASLARSGENSMEAEAFRKGFSAALAALALGFGIDWLPTDAHRYAPITHQDWEPEGRTLLVSPPR